MTFVYGEGFDEHDDFVIWGSVDGDEIAFTKWYLKNELNNNWKDYNVYQGNFDQTMTIITGMWQGYLNGKKAVYNGITNPEKGKDVYNDTFTLRRL